MKYAIVEITRVARDANISFEEILEEQGGYTSEWDERAWCAYRQKVIADAALLAAGRKMMEL